jgi:tetratricopeptide (TPR) repeat protein
MYSPIIAYSAFPGKTRREAGSDRNAEGDLPVTADPQPRLPIDRAAAPIRGGGTCYISSVTTRRVAAFGLALLLWVPRAASAASLSGADELLESRKMFLAARSAVADGQFQEALGLYRKVIAKLPSDPVVHLEYAQLLRDLNVVDEATAEARKAVELDPNLAEARRLLGALELSAAEKDPSRLPDAIEQLNAARRLAPGDVATAVGLARALLAADRPAEAAVVLDDLPEVAGQPGIQRLTADAKAKSGHWKEAEALYKGLHELDPADREISAALIDLYEDQDKMDDALALLEELQKRDPSNAAVGERIVLDLARAGRFAESEKRARDLVAQRPENAAAKRLLATVLFEQSQSAEGEKILRALADADPDDPSARRALASEFVRERRFDAAKPIYDDLIKRAGNDPAKADSKQAATVELGFIDYLQRDYDGARKILAPVALNGKQVNSRAARILLAADRDSENWTDGLQSARAYAAAEPNEAEWTAAAAEFLWHSDRKAAEAKLDEMGKSDDIDRLNAAGDAYARLKDYEAAARISREASREYPENTEALFRLGSSLERSGNAAEAEEVFLKILAMRPNDAPTLNYLGYMWADKGVQLEKAKEFLEKAVRREPRNAAYLDSLGWAYFRLGKMDSAERNLREAYRREPTDPTIEEHMGDLDAKLGNLESAVRHWEKALQLKHEEPERVREKLRRAGSPVTQR